MTEYPKINTVFKRDISTKFKTIIDGGWSQSEFEYLANNMWIFTEKVDGTNIRVMWNNENKILTFGGKTDNAQIPAFLVNKLQQMFKLEVFDSMFDASVCLYGEGYGAKIQKGGGNYRQDQSFVLFDVKIENWWLQRKDVVDLASKLGIEVVPIIGLGTLFNMVELVKKGFQSTWGSFEAEGVVARPEVELQTRSGNRIITKLKCKDFRNNE